MERSRDLAGELMAFVKSGRVEYCQADFQAFWQEAENPRFRGECIHALVRHSAESGRWGRYSGLSLEAAISTLALIVLINPINPNFAPEYKRLSDEARRRWSAGHVISHTNADKCISSILAVAAGEEGSKAVQLLAEVMCSSSPLVRKDQRLVWTEGRLSSLGSHFGWAGPHIVPNRSFCELETGLSCLFPLFIRTQLKLTASNSFLELYYPLLLSAISCDSPVSLPLILHFLESGLDYFPLHSLEHLEQVAAALDFARRRPRPQARAAQRVMQKLHWERRCPGASLMAALEERFPWVLTVEKLGQGEKIANAFILLNEEEAAERELFEDMERLSRKALFEQLRGLNLTLNQAEDGDLLSFLSHLLRIQAISFLSRSLASSTHSPSLPDIHQLSTNDIYRLFQRLRNLLAAISSADLALSDSLIAQQMTDLLEDAQACVPEINSTLSHLTSIYFGEEGRIAAAPTSPAAYLLISTACIGPGRKDQRESPAAFHFASVLSAACARAKSPTSVFYRRTVKVVLVGSDRLLHSFLCSYLRRDVQYPADSPVRLYVVPDCEDSSSLAAYIATIDTWYNRNLYVPFAKRPFAPRLVIHSEENQHKRKGTTELTTGINPLEQHFPVQNDPKPTVALHSLLQDYLQEGRSTVLVKVLEVRCWRRDNSESEPDLILPMAIYLELGYPAAAMRAKQDNLDRLGDKSIEEIMARHLFPFSPPSILISAVQIDLMGSPYEKPEEALKEVKLLTVSNLPRASDYWTAANPSAPSFELAFLETRFSGEVAALDKKRTQRGKMKLSDYESSMKALHTNLHVSKVKLTGGRNEGFDVRVDGVLYGPFGVVEVQSWKTSKGPLMLSIATFLDTC